MKNIPGLIETSQQRTTFIIYFIQIESLHFSIANGKKKIFFYIKN